MGLSRDTIYRYKQAVEDGGVESLLQKDRRKPNPKNRVDEQTEAAVLQYALDFPAHGQVRTSNELRKLGVFVSASGGRVLLQQPEERANQETDLQNPQLGAGRCLRLHRDVLQSKPTAQPSGRRQSRGL